MRVGVITKGTRGDVQPLLALAIELRRRGHEVAICCPSCVVPLVEERGILAFGMSFDPKKAIESPEMQRAIRLGDGALCIKAFNSSQERQISESGVNPGQEAYDFVKTFQADLLVGHPSFVPLIAVAEAFQLPLLNALFMPFLPSSVAHPAFFTRANLAKLGFSDDPLRAHKQLWDNYITAEEFAQLNLLRQKWGLKPHKNVAETQAVYQCAYEANCWSPHLLPKPSDLHLHFPDARQTGFLFADAPTYKPCLALRRFLAQPSKPVYVGFGSLCVGDPGEATEKVLRALMATQRRCVMVAGWSGLHPSHLDVKTKDYEALMERLVAWRGSCWVARYASQHVYALESCPHDWLLPRCCCAVHHGGAGTVAAVARAGLVQLVMPVAWDQPWWGEHLEQLQVGIKLPMIAQASVEQLTEALQRSSALAGKAAELGALILAERPGHETLADRVLEIKDLPQPWPTAQQPRAMQVKPPLWERLWAARAGA